MHALKKIVLYMQEYLDGDLSRENEQVLKEHLQKCLDLPKSFSTIKKDYFLC